MGTASWTDKTLLASGWYPPSEDTAEKRLAQHAEQTHVLLNNCYADYAQRNAAQLMSLLTDEDAEIMSPD